MHTTALKGRHAVEMGLIAAAVATLLAFALAPAHAFAETMEELQQRVTDTSATYDEAAKKVEDLQAQISANRERVTEIEAKLPEVRHNGALSIRAQFKLDQSSLGLLDLMLSADDFYQFLQTLQFLDSVTSYNSNQIHELVTLTNELQTTRDQLSTQLAAAQEEQRRAADALSAAQEARTAMRKQVEAQQAAEAAEAQAALNQAAREAGDSFTTESGVTTTVEVPSNDGSATNDDSYSGENVNWNDDKASFVNSWGSRIDAFLAGSPLAGHGRTFAEAAWTNGIDPRLSPAISAVESGKGRVCFRPYNAWGWGNVSWSDWDSAIWSHVSGLARGYDPYLTYAMAQKYCPPNAAAWYSSVAACIQQI